MKTAPKEAKSEPKIPQNDLTEDNDFVDVEVGTPNLNYTERREVNLEENNSQINPGSETEDETVEEELFETPICESTRESINTNIYKKSRSTKVPAPKIATQQKR